MIEQSNFPEGVVVFFRTIVGTDKDGTVLLARSVHPTGRTVKINALQRLGDIPPLTHPEDYMVFDSTGRLLGIYPRDWIAGILPLVTIGPGVSQ